MFAKAERKQIKARIGLAGPPGAGKTYTGLRILKHMGCKKIAVIDTERGSASKYIGDPELPEFDVCNLDTYAPSFYAKAVAFASNNGYDGILIDSLSHSWNGDGGVLDIVSKEGKNGFKGWDKANVEQNAMMSGILGFPGHVVCTFRTKNAYSEGESANGKKTREKTGLAPVFKEDVEYELDVMCYLDQSNVLHVEKTRCPALTGQTFRKAGPEFAAIMKAWCEDGVTFDEEGCLRQINAATSQGDVKLWADIYRASVSTQAKDIRDRIVAAHKAATERIAAINTGSNNTQATQQGQQ